MLSLLLCLDRLNFLMKFEGFSEDNFGFIHYFKIGIKFVDNKATNKESY